MSKHIFCELDELQPNLEWKETARWLKFEEDVENGGRWSKPHVATLSLHSLFELRKCLSNDEIFFDLHGDDLLTIINKVLLYSVQKSVLKESDLEQVKSILLSKHIHQHEKDFKKQIDVGEKKVLPIVKSFSDLTKSKQSNLNNLGNFTDSGMFKNSINNSTNQTNVLDNFSNQSKPIFELNETEIKIKRNDTKPKDLLAQFGSASSISNLSNRLDFKTNHSFMKKIPNGTEASNVLVGEVDFLDYQFSTFIRLTKAVVLGDFTEVSVPTRFLFIILGPKGNIQRYHEIGRSIATMLSDEIFLEVAYTSKNRYQLLKDQVIVLPPGEWDPTIRIEPPQRTMPKKERLGLISEATGGLNGSIQSGLSKKVEDEIKFHDPGPGLEFTGRFCGGLINDLKRKLPFYLSDFKESLNFQCLSSVLFMYFACLAPIVTFGGLLGAATDNNMSAIESLVSGAICGILFSFFAGQPLAILGSTGPVLVFESILNSFSKQYGIDYMGFRALIGLWMTIFLILIVVFDLSAFVKYITRFTEESFAALIAFIFISESIRKLFEINKQYKYSNDLKTYFLSFSKLNCSKCINNKYIDLNKTVLNLNQTECENSSFKFVSNCNYVPDVFFFSVILYMSTFLMAMSFKAFRNSKFFPSIVRSKISDFGVIITILVNVLIDGYFKFDTPKLNVPLKFETTIPSRGWFINPIERIGNKWWFLFLAIIPAFLATILIFMDQHITAVIINRKENKLKKSFGYHLDLLVIAVTIAINSLLGIPWFVAATVLSINNVLSLKKESESSVPGEKPKFLGVIEQRLTGVVLFSLIGSSVFLAKYLKKIPMPVLYGVFLYMGISSLNGMQFMHRLILPFMPEKYQPDHVYLRHVRTFKVHMFTLIQIACLALLFIIKTNKTISITFPIMVLALVGVRKLLDYFFSQKELFYLDQVISANQNKNKTIENPALTMPSHEKSRENQIYFDAKKRFFKTNLSNKSINRENLTTNNNSSNISLNKMKNKEKENIREPLLVNNNNNNKVKLPPPKIIIVDTDAEKLSC